MFCRNVLLIKYLISMQPSVGFIMLYHSHLLRKIKPALQSEIQQSSVNFLLLGHSSPTCKRHFTAKGQSRKEKMTEYIITLYLQHMEQQGKPR